jgi:hypothetical protein
LQQAEGRGSFLKKRTKKLLRRCRGLAGEARDSVAKVFASFFKKKRFAWLNKNGRRPAGAGLFRN